MTPKLTAGSRLRRDMESSRERVCEALNQNISWDESDRISIDRAAQTADRAEQLRAQYERELRGEARASTLTKLSAELRQLDRLVVEITHRVCADLARIMTRDNVNVTKQRAADYRWSRQSQAQ